MTYDYPYPHPAIATDIAIFTLNEGRLRVLLVQRKADPFGGAWALPGGFLDPNETLDACARRELREETGVEARMLVHFGNYSEPDRDPRERVVSVAYLALLPLDQLSPGAADDAAAVDWFPLDSLPPLAFDHDRIMADALEALRGQAVRFGIILGLLPERFTFGDFQQAYEAVIGRPSDRRNLYKALMGSGLITATADAVRGRHRPAQIFERNPDV